jgi:hypothetical protein
VGIAEHVAGSASAEGRFYNPAVRQLHLECIVLWQVADQVVMGSILCTWAASIGVSGRKLHVALPTAPLQFSVLLVVQPGTSTAVVVVLLDR